MTNPSWCDAMAWRHASTATCGAVTSCGPQTAPPSSIGHAEEDLASLSVFGAPFTERIRAAYDEESPLAPGWQERIELHQVHMLVMHCAVFGRSYVGPTVSIARRWA